MILMSVSDLVKVVEENLHGILEIYHFLAGLPNLILSFILGMPMYFRLGFGIAATSIIIVLILKLKTYLLF